MQPRAPITFLDLAQSKLRLRGQLERLEELPAFGDNDLLDLVMGRAASPDPRHDNLLQLLRTA